MSARKLVAYNLRKLRISREISQENLAVDVALDWTNIGRLEGGLETVASDTWETSIGTQAIG